MDRFHLHVYFNAQLANEVDLAAQLRTQLARHFQLPVGSLHRQPVGPHPAPMFQAILGADDLAAVLPWLMQHRGSLPVLVHADTGDDLLDHTRHVLWLGNPLPLRTELL